MKPLVVNSPVPPTKITAIVASNPKKLPTKKGTTSQEVVTTQLDAPIPIYVGTSDGMLIKMEFNPNSSKNPFIAPNPLPPALGNFIIKQIFLLETDILIQTTTNESDKKSYKIYLLNGQTFQSDFSVNAPFCSASQSNFVTATGSKFSLYKLPNMTPSTKDVQNDIQALSINASAVAFFAGGKYRIFWISSSTFSEVTSANPSKPLIHALDDLSFVFCLPSSMILNGKNGEKTCDAIQYPTLTKGTTNTGTQVGMPLFMANGFFQKEKKLLFFSLKGFPLEKFPISIPIF